MLAGVPPNKILRFDTRKLHAALNARRIERNMTWAQVAKEARVSASTLTYLSRGTRAWFPAVTRITGWLDRPVAEFTRASDR
jgi:transcriptional regulator with XRE-family HTH domain